LWADAVMYMAYYRPKIDLSLLRERPTSSQSMTGTPKRIEDWSQS